MGSLTALPNEKLTEEEFARIEKVEVEEEPDAEEEAKSTGIPLSQIIREEEEEISNNPVWEIALRDFIQESFREQDRNSKKKAKFKIRRKLPVSSNQANRPVASRMQGEEDLLFSAEYNLEY
ncbi:hypothetical protein NADE_001001 [Nannochloris sp. 'desiccata']|nr:hypothetical protein NADE_001001 [Chlorella desiccata (nom. nud.)]